MKKLLTHWTIAFVTLFVLTFIGFKDPQVKEILRLKGFDLLLQSEKKEISTNIAVVSIDEKAMEKYGQWPWKRDILADIIIQLREQGAGVIVLPILFSEPDRLGGDEALTSVLEYGIVISQIGTNQTNKNSVPRGVAKINDPLPFLFEWGGMLGPIIEFHNASGVGVSNTIPEVDGVVRRIPLLMKIGEDIYPAMAIEVIRVAVGAPSYQVKSGDAGIIAMRVPGFNKIETDANSRIWLRWNKSYPTISIADLETNEISLEGKTVIIGMSAEGLGGIIATPVGERYAYELTASTLDTVLDGKNIKRVDISFLSELAVSFLLGAIIIVMTRFMPYWVIGIKLISWYIVAVWLSHFFFTKYSMLVDVSWIIIVFTIVGFHSVFNRFILEFKLKQQIRKQFEKYLDPRQVAILVKNPEKLKLGGDRKEMSFLFMDIVGFTPISEFYKNNDDPEGLVNVINDYLNRMSKIVLKNGGTIDKYMGDCIMAFWNAPLDCPNHAEMAVQTGIECAIETQKLKKEFKERGLPDINIGSGVNTGTCIVGNMGSENRLDYSVIGDAVNLAARLEAATRNYKDDNGNVAPLIYLLNLHWLKIKKQKLRRRKRTFIKLWKLKRLNTLRRQGLAA
jgi:adenylate cyclase